LYVGKTHPEYLRTLSVAEKDYEISGMQIQVKNYPNPIFVFNF
jgi:hypothetical protein